MSESIITAESLQEADDKQDKADSPDENKEENLQSTESEDSTDEEARAKSDEEATETEAAEADEGVETNSKDDAEDAEEDEEVTEKSEKPDIPKWAEKRLQRQSRKHEREIGELTRRIEQQNAGNQQNAITYDQSTQMQDPFTGNIVDINSVEGQVALKLQQVSQIQEQSERQQQTQDAQEKLKRKLDKGRDKYEDFDDVTEHAGITLPMLNAAYLSDDTDELLYNLAKYKPEEIDRISKLSPERQNREMVLMETKMKQSTKKKIVKKVPEPPSKIKGSGSSMTEESDLSFEDLLKRRRKAQEDRYNR